MYIQAHEKRKKEKESESMLLLLGVPEHLKEETNKWHSDYIELMQHKKDPGYGGTKCHGCLLCPQEDKFGIHKVIA